MDGAGDEPGPELGPSLLSTVLFGLATLELVSFSEAPSVLGLLFWAPTWLAGLGAVWQLWRAASGVFFRGIPHDRARPAVAKMQR